MTRWRRVTLVPLLVLLAMVTSRPDRAVAEQSRQNVLNIYAWVDYFPKPVIQKFQAETGIRVNFTVFDSPDTAETTLSAGASNYDIVTMNAVPHLAREIPQGFWKVLDRAQIPNAQNADPDVLRFLAQVDPGNTHAVPWMWGTTGVIYDIDKAKSLLGGVPANSLDMVFNKDMAAKFASCGISFLDSWQDILPMVSRYLGQPSLSTEPTQLGAVLKKLQEIRPYLRRIASSGYYEQLGDGDLCLAIGYSGDAMFAQKTAREGGTKIRIDFAYPAGPVPLWVDSMVIPADSPNVSGALRFINFMMRPEISAEVTRSIGFPSGNRAALELLDPAVRNNAIVYPPAAVRARFETGRVYSAEELRTFTRAWQRFSTGQ